MQGAILLPGMIGKISGANLVDSCWLVFHDQTLVH